VQKEERLMSMIISKKQITITTVILVLVAAIVAGWNLTGTHDLTNADTIKTSSVNTANTVDSFFAAARLTRENAEAESNELLNTQVTNSSNTTAEQQSAKSEINSIDSNVSLENNIEGLIEADGFEDCIVIINDGMSDVVLQLRPGDSLSSNVVALVENIVIQQAKITADNIRIYQYQ
jgi:stage III sporulation protein AH